jgi:hypothetical protein
VLVIDIDVTACGKRFSGPFISKGVWAIILRVEFPMAGSERMLGGVKLNREGQLENMGAWYSAGNLVREL